MQVGIMSGQIQRPTLEETLDAILEHGMRHVHFNWSSADQKGPLDQTIGVISPVVREQVQKRDMTIVSVPCNANMTDPDETKRAQAIDRFKLIISACDAIGTSIVGTATGSRNPDSMWRHHADNQSHEAWQVLRDSLEKILPAAESAGVFIAFEPEVNNVTNNARRSRQIIDEMASPNLKVIMDASNLFGKGDLARMTEVLDEAFDLLGEHIVQAHGKDLDHDGDAGHLAAGTGKLDYERYVKLLCALPFDVPVILHSIKEVQVDDAVAMLRAHARKWS